MYNLPDHFVTFIVSAAIASFIPGLAVMGAFTISLKEGFNKAFIFSVGLVTASMLYFALSAVGLITILKSSLLLFNIIKYIGIFYLIYLGISSYKNSNKITQESLKINQVSGLSFYMSGLMVHLVNPKNILFFVVVLPQYLNIQKSISIQMIWLAIGSTIPEFLILMVYIFFAKKLKKIFENLSTAIILNKIIGILFISLGLSMIFLF